MPTKKSFHEEFSRFFETPSRETLRDLLARHVGELNHCDFKEQWPDLSKVARHVLGLANSGGGAMVVGVLQTQQGALTPTGLTKILDKADISKGLQKFIPSTLEYEVLDFAYESSDYPSLMGKRFQVMVVEDKPADIPYVCQAEGTGIRLAAVYVRRGTNTEEANHDELKGIISRRVHASMIAHTQMDLDQHLAQLKTLYTQIQRNHVVTRSLLQSAVTAFKAAFQEIESRPNPHYPPEDFEQFIARMIRLKQLRIELLLDVKGLE